MAESTVDRLEAERDAITGVVVTSAKKTLPRRRRPRATLPAAERRRDRRADVLRDGSSRSRRSSAGWRRSASRSWPRSTAPRSAAAWRLALACHHRDRASTAPDARFGLPEVTLGLLPGGGGVIRVTRACSACSDALMKVLLQGQRMRPAEALEIGLVDELVADRDELVPAARGLDPGQPGARRSRGTGAGYRMPGGTPDRPGAGRDAAGVPGQPAQAAQGRALPGAAAPSWRAAVEGAQVDFDTALAHREPLVRRRWSARQVAAQHDPGVLLRPAAPQRGAAPGPKDVAAVRRAPRSACSAPG